MCSRVKKLILQVASICKFLDVRHKGVNVCLLDEHDDAPASINC